MLANELLDRLERLGLLDQEIIEALREQLRQSGFRVTPEKIAQLLVDNGQLTRFQASKLIGELRRDEYESADSSGQQPATSGPPTPPASRPSEPQPELGLADDDIYQAEVVEAVVVEAEVVDAEIVDAAGGDAAMVDAQVVDAEVVDAEVVDAEVVDAEVVAGEVGAGEVIEVTAEAVPPPITRSSPPKRPQPAWKVDSIAERPAGKRRLIRRSKSSAASAADAGDDRRQMLTYFAIAAAIASVLGGLLYLVLMRDSVEDRLARGAEAFAARQYAAAERDYSKLVGRLSNDHPQASLARTRVVLAKLHQIGQSGDQLAAVEATERWLPRLVNEPALETERGQVAGWLVTLSEQIMQRATETPEIEKKQQLLELLERPLALLDAPEYESPAAKVLLTSRLQAMADSRFRVQREVDRQLQYDHTITQIDQALAAEDPRAAIGLRMELIRQFPELRQDARLSDIVESVSSLQKAFVQPLDQLPQPAADLSPSAEPHTIVLSHRMGGVASGVSDAIYYAPVHGAVVALAADDGQLLWRRFIDANGFHPPLPLGSRGDQGVLISGDTGHHLRKIAVAQPQTVWETQLDESFLPPVVQAGEVLLSTASGRVLALDESNGQPRWGTQLPQPVLHSPSPDPGTGKLYMVGDHHHLYVLDRHSGECPESFYLGHETGAVVVPPAVIAADQGSYVLVFDNAQPTHTLVHVLKTNPQGLELVQAQLPIRLHGNVTAATTSYRDGSVVALTDHGQVTLLGLAAVGQQDPPIVASVQVVAAYDSSQDLAMALDGDQLWVTGPRISRFVLDTERGRAGRDWVLFEGDRFVTPPQVIGNTLLHTRALRNTAAIRITAAKPQDGRTYWQTDLGAPVAMITANPDGDRFHLVSGQAGLFELTQDELESAFSIVPIENPGNTAVAMRFEHALMHDPQTGVILNRATGAQLAVYDGDREKQKLRLITTPASGGAPVGDGHLAAGRLLLPLDSGAIALVNWQTGQRVIAKLDFSLFGGDVALINGQTGQRVDPLVQPKPDNGDSPRHWTTPISLPAADDQVILADDRPTIYRFQVQDQLQLRASQSLPHPLRPTVAALGKTLVAIAITDAGDRWTTFDSQSLEPQATHPLPAEVTWGPYAVGDQLLLRLDDGPLRAYDVDCQPRFTVDIAAGQLLPGVALLNGQAIVADEQGRIIGFDPNSGRLTGSVDLHQPLAGLPVAAPGNNRLLVPGKEGTVYVTSLAD